MADVNILVNNIIAEAEAEAKSILDNATAVANDIVSEGKALSEHIYSDMVEDGKKEGKNIRERLRGGAMLKSRDDQLKTKQEMILRVFDETLEDFKKLGTDDYLGYIKKNISDKKGTTLIVTKDMVDEVKAAFTEHKVSTEEFVESGFIEDIGGIENNFTFETQLEFYKDELEGEVAKILFG